MAETRIGRINVYTCPHGHQTVTRDAADGTTPFTIDCHEGGHGCFRGAQSAVYRVDQALVPTHEWYRPTEKQLRRECRRYRAAAHVITDHVQRGGLLLRRVPSGDS